MPRQKIIDKTDATAPPPIAHEANPAQRVMQGAYNSLSPIGSGPHRHQNPAMYGLESALQSDVPSMAPLVAEWADQQRDEVKTCSNAGDSLGGTVEGDNFRMEAVGGGSGNGSDTDAGEAADTDVDPDLMSRMVVGDDHFILVGKFRFDYREQQMSHSIVDKYGCKWRILVFAHGENKNSKSMAVFLELADLPPTVDSTFTRKVAYQFALLAPQSMSGSLTRSRDIFEFQDKGSTRGYTEVFERRLVTSTPRRFLIPDGWFMISVIAEDVGQPQILAGNGGMVGLKNQGATCYMNSLLQTLFHLGKLRRAVYNMPTWGEDDQKGVALALQRTFWKLQTSQEAVGTKELTRSFGWDSHQSFLQQDVQELNRVLCDKLEESMKGTPVAGTIKNLFEGETQSYIQCVNVDYKSSRTETFYDIQLDVKGCKNIYESFRKYSAEELMEGDDMYDAGEQHGKQVAKRGIVFTGFPPVLSVHLKRFEYDIKTHRMVKVNDRFEFPFRLDMGEFLARGGEDDAATATAGESAAPHIYILHSVLVHSGDVHSGHYYAYVRPSSCAENQGWAKFDDETVTLVPSDEAIEGNYGASRNDQADVDPLNYWGTRPTINMGSTFTNAYMLVYVRASDLQDVMRLEGEGGELIPSDLAERFQKEEFDAKERKRIEREAHLYMNLHIATVADAESSAKFEMSTEFVDWKSCRVVRIKKEDSIGELIKAVSSVVDIPLDMLRLWTVCHRQNQTLRIDQVLEKHELSLAVCEVTRREAITAYFFAERVELQDSSHLDDPDDAAMSAPQQDHEAGIWEGLCFQTVPHDHIFVCLKFYDQSAPLTQASPLKLLGLRFVHLGQTVRALVDVCAEMLGIPNPPPMTLWEVISPKMVTILRPAQSLREAELINGDIICCQISPGAKNAGATVDPAARIASQGTSDGCAPEPAKKRRVTKASPDRPYEFREGAYRFAARPDFADRFFEEERCRRLIHFVPQRKEGGLYLPLGSLTLHSRPGLTIELLSTDSSRTIMHILARFLDPEIPLDPLQLRLSPYKVSSGTAHPTQPPARLFEFVDKFSLEDLRTFASSSSTRDVSNKTDTLAFDVLPFPLDEWKNRRIVEVFCVDRALTIFREAVESKTPLWRKQQNLQDVLASSAHELSEASLKSATDLSQIPLLESRICVSVDANAQVKNVLDAFREKLQVSAELELRIYCFNRGIVSLIANPQECCATLPDSTYLYRRFGETIQIALDTWRNKLPRTPPSLEQVQESTMPVQVVRFSLLGNGLPEFFGVPYITSVSSHEEVHDVAKRMAEDRIDVDVDDLLETRSALVSNHSSRVTYVDEMARSVAKDSSLRGECSFLWSQLRAEFATHVKPLDPHDIVWRTAPVIGFLLKGNGRNTSVVPVSSYGSRRYEGGIKIN